MWDLEICKRCDEIKGSRHTKKICDQNIKDEKKWVENFWKNKSFWQKLKFKLFKIRPL